jgi:hypothetical protein
MHSRKTKGASRCIGGIQKPLLFQHYIDAQQENKRERAGALGAFKKNVAVSAFHEAQQENKRERAGALGA